MQLKNIKLIILQQWMEMIHYAYKVTSKRLTRDDIYIADEAFFTGTAAEVTPIRELDNRTIGAGSRGPITAKIQSLFFDVVNGRVPAHADWLSYI